MKIDDKIFVPHVCHDCGAGQAILRDDLHENPIISCPVCGAEMRQWTTYKEEVQPWFDSKTGQTLTYTQKLREIIGTPWDMSSGSIVDIRKKVGHDLVDDPGMPDMVFAPSQYEAAQIQAELMEGKVEDLVVTLVVKSRFTDSAGTIRVESIRYSMLAGRIAELKHHAGNNKGHVFVISAYCEQTKQEFWWNNMELDNKPRMPGYDLKYDKKRKGYRTPADAVI